jgi:hypothetical protein
MRRALHHRLNDHSRDNGFPQPNFIGDEETTRTIVGCKRFPAPPSLWLAEIPFGLLISRPVMSVPATGRSKFSGTFPATGGL